MHFQSSQLTSLSCVHSRVGRLEQLPGLILTSSRVGGGVNPRITQRRVNLEPLSPPHLSTLQAEGSNPQTRNSQKHKRRLEALNFHQRQPDTVLANVGMTDASREAVRNTVSVMDEKTPTTIAERFDADTSQSKRVADRGQHLPSEISEGDATSDAFVALDVGESLTASSGARLLFSEINHELLQEGSAADHQQLQQGGSAAGQQPLQEGSAADQPLQESSAASQEHSTPPLHSPFGPFSDGNDP